MQAINSRTPLLCLLAFALNPATPLPAALIEVHPGESIQAAVSGAEAGDEIVVHPGEYPERLDLLGKAITLRALNPATDLGDPLDPSVATIVDLSGVGGSAVRCVSGEAADTIIDGFTLRHGTGSETPDGSYSGGGGILAYQSSPTIRRCVIRDNSGLTGAGMLNHQGSHPPIVACVFQSNNTDDYGDGGGMYNAGNSHPAVTDCRFVSNRAWFWGGAMYNDESTPVVRGCRFQGNRTNYAGGAIFNADSSPDFVGCRFDSNQTAEYGGAICNCWESHPRIVSSCFTNNNGGGYGGAVSSINGASLSIVNSVLFSNSGYFGAALHQQSGGTTTVQNCTFIANDGYGLYLESGDASVTNSILWYDSGEIFGSATVSFSNVMYGYAGMGNIDAEPMLANPWSSDYRLQPGSPCIDAGSNYDVPADDCDLDGDGDTAEYLPLDFMGLSRQVDDPNTADTGWGVPPLVDMGACEFHPTPCLGDLDGDGDTDQADLGVLLASYNQDDGGDLDGDGDTDQADLGILLADYGCAP
jgi:Right handed beta helix region